MVLLAIVATSVYLFTFKAKAPPKYETEKVSCGDIENTITSIGILQPSKYVDVGAQVSGQLKTLKVQAGDVVKQGDFLAEIDPTIYSAKVSEATATLENLKAQLKMKEAQLVLVSQQNERNQALLQQDAIAKADVEKGVAAYKSAEGDKEALQAQIKQAEAAMETAKANLNYTKILAPISGTVVSLIAREGQTLNANQQAPIILRIADMSIMTVWSQVSEADIPRLKVGQEVYFTTLGLPDKRWYGKLRQILPTPEIINNVILYNALFDVPNLQYELKVQMTVQVFFVLEKAQNALFVPVSALQPIDKKRNVQGQKRNQDRQPKKGKRFIVRVLKADGSPENREVVVGVMNAVSAEVISGLQEGETIITGTGAPAQKTKQDQGLGGAKRGKP